MDTENQSSSNNQKQSQTESQIAKEPSPLGCLLTSLIAIGASILAGVIYTSGAANNVNTLSGMGETASTLMWVVLITLFVVGGIMYAVMTKLLPKKPRTPNTTKSKDS